MRREAKPRRPMFFPTPNVVRASTPLGLRGLISDDRRLTTDEVGVDASVDPRGLRLWCRSNHCIPEKPGLLLVVRRKAEL